MTDRELAQQLALAAERDVRALEGMGDASVFADEIFGFHAQQAVEKALKAWLAAQGEIYPYTHDISALLSALEQVGQDVGALWDLVELNAFAVQLRYESLPDDDSALDRAATLDRVRRLLDRVREMTRVES